jgi:hypothetical protein
MSTIADEADDQGDDEQIALSRGGDRHDAYPEACVAPFARRVTMDQTA